MHSPVSAIRTGRSRPRFAQPLTRSRERSLGLGIEHRSRIVAAVTHRPAMVLHPLAAVRAAARSLVRPAPSAKGTVALSLQRARRMAWARRAVDGFHTAREGSAAAWRA